MNATKNLKGKQGPSTVETSRYFTAATFSPRKTFPYPKYFQWHKLNLQKSDKENSIPRRYALVKSAPSESSVPNRPVKGKPFERSGRKTIGLKPHTEVRVARSPGRIRGLNMEKRTGNFRHQQAALDSFLNGCRNLLSNFMTDQKNLLGLAFASLAPEPIPIRQQRNGFEHYRNRSRPSYYRN